MEKKFTTAPFDLEKAKAGEPICTRDGQDARIICWNRICKQPIVALVKEDGVEVAYAYNKNGIFCEFEAPNSLDLMMKVEVKESSVFVCPPGGIISFEEYKASGRANIKDLSYLIIKTHDGKYLRVYKHTLPAASFEDAQKAAAELVDWRCPTRHECIDVYDARFKGLDEAMKEIGGDELTECYWTCEADSDPQYSANNAVYFNGNSGNLRIDYKYNKYSVIAVCPINEPLEE